ncbi:hypothetical protein HZU83_15700 [Sphaerotilus montanus]|uniref:Uncharacterized protein n=1 Tax=Sphaerotilus montanus TaxID=522889 RepID=A0A7Y9UK72_9BURK|nr:hypothetical protein [Sphaerotilus montanus]NYG33435.1 hypothetical protein [Sphaerotilus montanus]NZD58137.1 hypothetical protein [Sphaerotilus montanus]
MLGGALGASAWLRRRHGAGLRCWPVRPSACLLVLPVAGAARPAAGRSGADLRRLEAGCVRLAAAAPRAQTGPEHAEALALLAGSVPS